MMKQQLMMILMGFLLTVAAMPLAAHDDKIHKATVGIVSTASADGLELDTKAGKVKVKYSSKTRFELKEKPAEKSGVRVGERVGVIGPKLPSGELMAREVILGVPEPKAAAKKAEQKH